MKRWPFNTVSLLLAGALQGNTWGQCELAKLTALNPEPSDLFGWSVAIEGDVSMIGVREDDEAGSASGSVRVFRRVEGIWTEQQELVASDGDGSDR